MGGIIFGRWLTWATYLIVPMFEPPQDVSEVGRKRGPLRWILHLLLVILIAAVLWWVQGRVPALRTASQLPKPWGDFWLPIAFVLGYATLWAVAWAFFWSREAGETSSHPDVDEAFSTILAELSRQGIGIQDTPIYVVFGRLDSGLEPVFRKHPRPLEVSGATPAASLVRCYANRDAIFLCLQNISLMGQSFVRTDQMATGATDQSLGVGQSIGVGQSVGMMNSMGMSGSHTANLQKALEKARSSPPPPEKLRQSESRLRHFSKRLASVRTPLCPCNGVLLMVSANINSADAAEQAGLTAQRELGILRDAMGQEFAMLALVGDISMVEGSEQFLRGFDKRDQRLGRGFPLVPDRSPEEIPGQIETNVDWVFSRLFPYLVFKQFELPESETDLPVAGQRNGMLYQFMAAFARRGPLIAGIVARAASFNPDGPPVFGGCYLDDHHPKAASDKSMTTEFFRKMDQSQGAVAWTQKAFARDAESHQKAGRIYAGLLVAAFLVVGLGAFVALR